MADDLDLILTVSNLRGLKYRINFQGKDPRSGTNISNHSGFFRYRVKNEQLPAGVPDDDTSLYFVLDLEGENGPEHTEFLKNATLSTAAFPIGLKARNNLIPSIYLARYTKHLFDRNEGITPLHPTTGDTFRFDSVDGGLLNNEPFGYAFKALKEKCPAIEHDKNFAMIMVDPFPNFAEMLEAHEEKKDIRTVATRTFKALRNQVMFKQDEIFNALDESDRTRFLIAPSRKELNKTTKRWDRKPNALASGALGGFSGFLDREFRQHDFELGRQNCQGFLRYYFALQEDEMEEKLNAPIRQEAWDRFCYSDPANSPVESGGKIYFPIFPDMRVLKSMDNTYDFENYGADAEFYARPFPKTNMDQIKQQYGDLAQRRIGSIVGHFLNNWLLTTLLSIFGANRKLNKLLFDEIEKGLRGQGLLEE